MQSRWFNAATVMLWLATMSWLVREKVLPSLLVGEPPNYGKIVEAQRDAPPVGWRMSFNDQPLGWALSETTLQPSGLSDIHGCVHFDTLPLEEIMPRWLRSLTTLIQQPTNGLQMDAKSTLTIDPLGHLLRFDSSVRVDPLNEVIRIQGTLEGSQLELIVRSGNTSFTNEIRLPSNSLLCDALSPQSILPGLRIGQEWNMPVYSPLWPTKNPLEIVHAKVEGQEPILWNGSAENCLLVVYRSDPGSGATRQINPRGRLWVRQDGSVLRQQVYLFDSVIRFDRLPDKEAAKLAKMVGQRWWSEDDEFSDILPWPERLMRNPTVDGGKHLHTMPPSERINSAWKHSWRRHSGSTALAMPGGLIPAPPMEPTVNTENHPRGDSDD